MSSGEKSREGRESDAAEGASRSERAAVEQTRSVGQTTAGEARRKLLACSSIFGTLNSDHHNMTPAASGGRRTEGSESTHHVVSRQEHLRRRRQREHRRRAGAARWENLRHRARGGVEEDVCTAEAEAEGVAAPGHRERSLGDADVRQLLRRREGDR